MGMLVDVSGVPSAPFFNSVFGAGGGVSVVGTLCEQPMPLTTRMVDTVIEETHFIVCPYGRQSATDAGYLRKAFVAFS